MKRETIKSVVLSVFSALVVVIGYNYFFQPEEPIKVIEQHTSSPFTQKLVNYPVNNSQNPEGFSFVEAAEKSLNAVVHVKNYKDVSRLSRFGSRSPFGSDPFEFFFGTPRRQQPPKNKEDIDVASTGSGVIVSEDGYIITNNHVIDGAIKLSVTLDNKKTYEAKLIGTDPNTDIALLKIEGKGFPFLPLSDSDQLRVGEWVLAVGNPFNLNSTVTAGIVSALGRNLNINETESPLENFIQTDAAVNSGNSGGALVNTRGELVGINTAISSQNGLYVGYAFAVPSNLAKKVIEDLLEFGVVQRAYVGIYPQDITEETIKNGLVEKDLKPRAGAFVQKLTEEGAAISAGIEQGDIIVKIDNKDIEDSNGLRAYLGKKKPGEVVSVTVLRDDKLKTIEVELRNKYGTTEIIKEQDAIDILKASFETPKGDIEGSSGVLVKNIEKDSPLQNTRLAVGDLLLQINGVDLSSQEDVNKVMKANQSKKQIEIRFYSKRYNVLMKQTVNL